jgi:long-chain acyl-CoA synthetase
MSRVRPHLDRLTAPGGPFEIVVEDVEGVPVRTFANRMRHLTDLVVRGEEHGAAEFVVHGEVRLTYAEAFDRSRRLAAGLRAAHGVSPGDRVAVLGSNAADWVVAYWAGILLDAVVTPLNAWWGPDELAHAVRDAEPAVLIADGRRAPLAIGAGMAPGHVIVWGDDPAGGVPLDSLLGDGRAEIGPIRDEDDAALLFYTSGTTGAPKGALLTHRNVVANVLNLTAMVRAARAAEEEGGDTDHADGQTSTLCVIPLFHATANLAFLAPYVAAGNRLVFLPPGRFDPEVAGEVIERERVTHFGGVPTVVNRILESGVTERRDFSAVRSVTYGGAPASPALVERIAAAFPAARRRLGQGYGLTETSAICTLNLGADYLEHPDSVGIAAPTVELRIDAEGEIQVRGTNVFAGYWRDPDATAAAFTDDGFFRTGDIGFLDDDGFLHITDRAKDVVIRGGENVYCVEVEAVLESHPAVAEAAVVGRPHPDLGEEVEAIVVLREPTTADELGGFVAEHLARFKVPTSWVFRDEELPRTATGKVRKQVLRDGSAVSAVGEDSAL